MNGRIYSNQLELYENNNEQWRQSDEKRWTEREKVRDRQRNNNIFCYDPITGQSLHEIPFAFLLLSIGLACKKICAFSAMHMFSIVLVHSECVVQAHT